MLSYVELKGETRFCFVQHVKTGDPSNVFSPAGSACTPEGDILKADSENLRFGGGVAEAVCKDVSKINTSLVN